ncbi:uncharacterized protein LOC109822761 [Asparagus officinalis]|uniref:uncharacterized protein LOC109822761 n=1 Tax=Asparagus officinalis TaxID=4686 RepID=UPI00098E1B8F|nr:uncharacterized protein LOC109822761 [Asparagus officinalis]
MLGLLQDFYIVEYDQLVSQCAPDDILKMRSLFDRALTVAGVHVVEVGKIWEAYREYEQAIFLTIGDDNNEALGGGTREHWRYELRNWMGSLLMLSLHIKMLWKCIMLEACMRINGLRV